jgi:serine/threonine-protein kinase
MGGGPCREAGGSGGRIGGRPVTDETRGDSRTTTKTGERTDEVCDRFEADWRAGRRPRVEDYVAQVPEPRREVVRAELSAVAAELGRRFESAGSSTSESTPSPGQASTLRGEVDTGAALRGLDETPVWIDRTGGGGAASGADATAPKGTHLGRYQDLGEIGRGGMGVVHRVRDEALHRDLALKLLSYRGGSTEISNELERRFIEEAQVIGQLQHPGIPPLHELGRLPDGRPYFTMKLIRGRTLREILGERPDPGAESPRFVAIFEQIAQTVAYAHRKRVLHRDLKPSNVMVGAFGEVQVMDWGLAKVLMPERSPHGGSAPSPLVPEGSQIRTLRDDLASAETLAGSLLGTPEYIAPEQARGDLGEIDERADVFGLGAILCQILIGQPPYVGRSSDEVKRKAVRGDLAETMSRLEGCEADPELVALARSCLAAEPLDRPRDAAAVAEAVSAYRAGVAERLRRAELARVREEARRRLTTVVAAAVVLLVTLGVGGYAWEQARRAERISRTTRAIDDALTEAARLRGEAQAAPADELQKWIEAVAAAKRADELSKQDEAPPSVRDRVARLKADVELGRTRTQERIRQAALDRALLVELEAIRGKRAEMDHAGQIVQGRKDESDDPGQTDIAYAGAFRKAGLDVTTADPTEAGRWIASRIDSSEIPPYLDDWALIRRRTRAPEAAWRRLLEIARVADPDPWRNALRDKITARGADADTAFRALADAEDQLVSQPAVSLILLANLLMAGINDLERTERVLRYAWRRFPGDFQVNLNLGLVLLSLATDRGGSTRWEECEAYLAAACAVRPQSHLAHKMLGLVLIHRNKFQAAAFELGESIRLGPDSADAYLNRGVARYRLKLLKEAQADFDRALALEPGMARAYLGRGVARLTSNDPDAAITDFDQAIQRSRRASDRSTLSAAYFDRGRAFYLKKDYPRAIEDWERVARNLDDRDSMTLDFLGLAYSMSRNEVKASRYFEDAVRHDTSRTYAPAHAHLGAVRYNQKDFEAAIKECTTAIEIDPNLIEAYRTRSRAFTATNQLDRARADEERADALGKAR